MDGVNGKRPCRLGLKAGDLALMPLVKVNVFDHRSFSTPLKKQRERSEKFCINPRSAFVVAA